VMTLVEPIVTSKWKKHFFVPWPYSVNKLPPPLVAASSVIVALKCSFQCFNLPHCELDDWTKAHLRRFALPNIHKRSVEVGTPELSPDEQRWRFLCLEEEPHVMQKDQKSIPVSRDVWRAFRSEGKLKSVLHYYHSITIGCATPWDVSPSLDKPVREEWDVPVDFAPTTTYTSFAITENTRGFWENSDAFDDLPNPYIAAILGASEIIGESPWALHYVACKLEQQMETRCRTG